MSIKGQTHIAQEVRKHNKKTGTTEGDMVTTTNSPLEEDADEAGKEDEEDTRPRDKPDDDLLWEAKRVILAKDSDSFMQSE
jgi:hypothetical protein